MNIKQIFLLLIVFSPLCMANDFDDLPEVKALQKGMPEDVAVLIPRVIECNHFAGEEAYDKDRVEFLKNSTEAAGCANIQENEVQLRQKYKNQPEILDAIKKAKDLRV